MKVEEKKVFDFLNENRGYLKKGPLVIKERLSKEGIDLTVEDIKVVVRNLKKGIFVIGNDIPSKEPEMRVRRKWTMPNGNFGYSYERNDSVEDQQLNDDAIKDYIEKNVTPKLISPPISDNRFILSAFTADKHIGAETARNSIYSNDYDREEIFRRHEELVKCLLWQKEIFGTFEKFIFYDLGDALDGMNNSTARGGHHLPQNMDAREQIDTFIEVTIATIEQLIDNGIASEIWFIATTNDNHSGSFGHGALRSVQLYLEAKYPTIIKTLVTAKVLDHITFGDHTYIFGHGKDDSDMKNGMPLNLDLKTEMFINDYIDRKKIRSKFIHVVKGDLHQSSENYGKRFRYKNNMSMYGSSKWIHTNFGSGEAGVDYEVTDLYSDNIYRSRLTYGHDS